MLLVAAVGGTLSFVLSLVDYLAPDATRAVVGDPDLASLLVMAASVLLAVTGWLLVPKRNP
jgi:hypothetical protein